MVDVERGGEAYTAGSWAEPDLDEAAVALRRIADDEADRTRLIGAARRRIEAMNDLDGAAAAVVSLLDEGKPSRRRRRSLRLST